MFNAFKGFFSKISIEEARKATTSKSKDVLKGHMTLVQLIAIGIGAIIGAGILVFPGIAAAQHAGPAILLSIALAAFPCMISGFSCAELASFIPSSGGMYTYAYIAIGRGAAMCVVSLSFVIYGIGAAAISSGWSAYFVPFVTSLGFDIPAVLSASYGSVLTDADGNTVVALFNLPAFLLAFIVTIFLAFSTDAAVKLNTLAVVMKVMVILAFVLFGIWYVNFDNLTPFIPQNTGVIGEFGFTGILAAAGIFAYSFNGFDSIGNASQEAKNPARDIPLAVVGSLVFAGLIYMLISFTLVGIVNYKELGVAQPIALAIDRIDKPFLLTIINIGVILGLPSGVLVLTYTIIRVMYAAANDGLVPKLFHKLHPKFKTPYKGTWILGSMVSIFSALLPARNLMSKASIAMCFMFCLFIIAQLLLRKISSEKRAFSAPWSPWPQLASLCLFFAIMMANFVEFIVITSYMCICVILMQIYFTKHLHKSSKRKKPVVS